MTEQEEMINRSTETIIGQVQAMKEMVNDFRDFAKTPTPQLKPVSINTLTSEILGLYEGSPCHDGSRNCLKAFY